MPHGTLCPSGPGRSPADLLAKAAVKLVELNEAPWAARLKGLAWSEEKIPEHMEKRKREGNCLFVFAMV